MSTPENHGGSKDPNRPRYPRFHGPPSYGSIEVTFPDEARTRVPEPRDSPPASLRSGKQLLRAPSRPGERRNEAHAPHPSESHGRVGPEPGLGCPVTVPSEVAEELGVFALVFEGQLTSCTCPATTPLLRSRSDRGLRGCQRIPSEGPAAGPRPGNHMPARPRILPILRYRTPAIARPPELQPSVAWGTTEHEGQPRP